MQGPWQFPNHCPPPRRWRSRIVQEIDSIHSILEAQSAGDAIAPVQLVVCVCVLLWTAKCELSNVTVHSLTRSRALSQSRASKPPLKRSPCGTFLHWLRWSPPLAWARMSSWEGAALDNIVQAIDSHNFFRGCTTPRGHPDHSRGHARSLMMVHARRKLCVSIIRTILSSAAPSQELTLAHARGGDHLSQWRNGRHASYQTRGLRITRGSR